MKSPLKFLPALAATSFLWLFLLETAPVSPASAQGFNSWESAEETVDTPAAAFLRKHGGLIGAGAAAVLFVVFSVIMGPLGRLPRRGGFGGFGSSCGFGAGGSNYTTKKPWQ